jgi:peptide/nickel transport system permease protein
MLTFIIRRLLLSIITVLLVTIIVFLLMQLVPGDPVLVVLGQNATEEQVELIRHEMWLDRPLHVQYVHWLSNAISGDFGRSITMNQDITKITLYRLPITFYLSSVAFIFGVVLGIIGGSVCALRRGSILDSIITLVANIGIAVPVFWLGILGIYYFGLHLHWFPIQGFTSPFDDFWLSIKQMVMPIICLVIPIMAGLIRVTRSSVLEVVRQDYIRTAWSKGLNERVIVLKHTLKNALIPVVTMMGFFAGSLVGGQVLVEIVFNIPGMGRFMAQAAVNKDFPVVQAGTLIISIVIILANLLVDLTYGWLDPRIRYS